MCAEQQNCNGGSAGFPTCCIADFQSAGRRKHQARKSIRTVCRLEALRHSRLGNLRYGAGPNPQESSRLANRFGRCSAGFQAGPPKGGTPNVKSQRLVLTGITGTLGRNLIEEVQAWPGVKILALLRAGSSPAKTFPGIEY